MIPRIDPHRHPDSNITPDHEFEIAAPQAGLTPDHITLARQNAARIAWR
ncbi:MAG: hypothetical protein NTV93_01840 [Verrucomicrobia bacterium]|nr:hypothetical protein [Verrucomicrobiota bacterium]